MAASASNVPKTGGCQSGWRCALESRVQPWNRVVGSADDPEDGSRMVRAMCKNLATCLLQSQRKPIVQSARGRSALDVPAVEDFEDLVADAVADPLRFARRQLG